MSKEDQTYKKVPENTKEIREKAILIGIEFFSNGSSLDNNLKELKGLAETAYYNVIAIVSQKLTRINPKFFIGKGKVEEVGQLIRQFSAGIVIFDENLSPAQNRNLENIFKCRVIDRSWLILEIFGNHARTREAKAQVELASLKYALPRLTKMWGHLSRQRGGIGMRDVGETQIQLDRRLIRDRITKLDRKLKQIDLEKKTQRKNRSGIYKVALVGYTNAGKSTLMNQLTGAETLVENKLFATLDSTIRKIKKNFPYPVVLSDTVGLIDKLPHALIASFKSTLDEVRDANLLIRMVDMSDSNAKRQIQTTNNVINDLGADGTDSLLVFNKADKVNDPEILESELQRHPNAIIISSKNGTGLDVLRKSIISCYESKLASYKITIKYEQAKLIPQIRKYAVIVKSDYKDTFISLDLRLAPGAKEKIEILLKDTIQVGKKS
ncbi:MAG: GTPase HflX [Nitrospina sp.]|jgi:GTPase|nr:GTPase HflX [Nitrospina sp.]MBT7754403.1 GTPase HflX [Gammaproteobacteria bacterium]